MTARPAVHLHHGCISVSDLDRSIEFYSTMLGFEQESRRQLPGGNLEIAFLRSREYRLELVCHAEAKPLPAFATEEKSDFQVIGTKHLSFGTDDAFAMHAYLSEQGVAGLTEVYDNNPTYYYFFFRDPDNIGLEVVCAKV